MPRVHILGEEKLNLLVSKLAQLRAEVVVDADMVSVSAGIVESVSRQLCGSR